MKVLHILDHGLPLHSGYTFRSCALIDGQRDLGWEPVLMTGPKQGASAAAVEEVDGYRYFRTAATPAPPVPAGEHLAVVQAIRQRLPAVLADTQPDLVHCHSPALNALGALAEARGRGLPIVHEVRAFWEDAAVDHGTAREWGLRYRLSRALESHVMRRVDHVFTICEGLRGDIVDRGISADKVTVIPNAVDVEDFPLIESRDAALEAELGLAGCSVLGFVGSFYAYEGLDLAIEALAQLGDEHASVYLLLVGGGPEEERLRRRVAELGLESRVRFTGRVPHGDVRRYYSLFDFALYPRKSMRLTELVTPLKPLESMALGKPVIASSVGGHRELIEDGVTGHLFAPDSATALAAAVRKALADRAGLDAMRQRGRAFVERERNWQASVARYVPVYERLLKR
ncbi:MAG: glycosyltransferase, exosortase A system-associated [Gammaproteobacteria bacterium]